MPDKLTITAYKDPKYTQKVSGGKMTVSINPETYRRSYQPVSVNNGQGTDLANGERLDATVVDPPPETFDIELWFDGTGAIPDTDDVQKEIDLLKKIALDYNGSIHSINYVILEWGGPDGLTFKGQLKSLDIDYLMFDPTGKPLRAKAKASFAEFIDAETREKQYTKNSPDLTHLRTVKDGDTLPLMCHRIYGSPHYYHQVARINQLAQFVKLQPGQQIIFPPLD